MKNIYKRNVGDFSTAIIVLAAVIGFSMAACDDGNNGGVGGGETWRNPPTALVGTWMSMGGASPGLVINANGTGTVIDDPVDSWKVKGSELKMDYSGVESVVKWTVSGNTLTLSYPSDASTIGIGNMLISLSPLTKKSGTDGPGGDGGKTKPEKLSNNATHSQAVAKLDAIIAYSGTPATTKQQAQELKSGITTPGFESTWVSTASTYITMINNMIDTIDSKPVNPGDNDDNEKPEKLTGKATHAQAVAALDAIIACPETPADTKQRAQDMKNSLTASGVEALWPSLSSTFITSINSMIDEIPDVSKPNKTKPEKLLSNATQPQAVAKLDAIIAYPETPADTKQRAQDMKTGLTASGSEALWASMSSIFITTINGMIDEIPGGSGGENPIIVDPERLRLSYNANGASYGEAPEDSFYRYGETVTIEVSPGNLAKDGCIFIGWNTAPDGSGTEYYKTGIATFTITKNITLYAMWVYESGSSHTHQWGEWQITTDPTCTAAGVETRVCIDDGTAETRAVAALGHLWNDNWVITIPPTITQAGVETDTCAHDSSHTRTRSTTTAPAITSVANLTAYLSGLPANTAATAYKIALNVNDISDIKTTLNNAANKYISLDLSGSTFTDIGWQAFQNCTSLTGVTIPESVTRIYGYVFGGCTSLTSVTMPNSLEYIEGGAFSGCTSLTSVDIPDSLIYIGGYAFGGCTSLASVIFPTNASLTTIYNSAFYGCTSLTGVTIPNSVENIESSAFADCSNLTGVTIPSSVASIGSGAFAGCDKLNITWYYNPALTSENFRSYIKNIIIPYGVASIGERAFAGCTNLTSVTIPNSVTSIEDRAFNGCTSLTSIIIPDSVESIGYGGGLYIEGGVFGGCTSLASITIPDSVKSIGGGTFLRCTSLTSVTIGSGITSIGGQQVFRGCTSLTSIIIPNNVTSIGGQAFMDCTSLTSVTFERAGLDISDVSFPGSSSLQTAYSAGGIGTYKRPSSASTTWTKQ